MSKFIIAIRLTLCTLAPASAFAIGGIPEINHNCATLLGCFSGDNPGYPVTINGSAGSSYRVSSDLIIPDENTHGISVLAPSITIDLGGFEIVRSGCESATIACTPATGSGYGVATTSNNVYGLVVKNGSVTGMGGGIRSLGPDSEATAIRARWNADKGFWLGDAAMIRDCNAYSNGGVGIETGDGSIVHNNISRGNGSYGILMGNASTAQGNTASNNVQRGFGSNVGALLLGNTAYLNGVFGLQAGRGSIVHGNTAFGNDDDGIRGFGAALISNNTSYSNNNSRDGIQSGPGSVVTGNTARSNTGYGIVDDGGGSLVQGNTLRGNSQGGLFLSPTTAYRRNVMTANTLGTVLSGYNMGSNFCNTALCP